MHDRELIEHALVLIDRARVAGITLKATPSGLTAGPAARLEPELKRALGLSCDLVLAALRAEVSAKEAIAAVASRHNAITPVAANTIRAPRAPNDAVASR